MLGISVELGTYSIKFLNYQVDKKTIHLLSTDEIVMDRKELINNNDGNKEETLFWAEQLKLVQEYLTEIKSDFILLLNIPSEIVSSRYIDFPIKNKKKAALMLPFQIEEDLPYSLSDCHWAESLYVEGDFVEATVGIVKKDHFIEFFDHLKTDNINPNILTSDVSTYNGFIRSQCKEFPKSFCIINLGHETTKSFYFHEGRLVSNHHSYVAGSSLTEAISKTYSISYDEATIYKHQNSFLLLEEQYEKVNENQKEFAKVMDATLAPLLSEIKRWDIGFRVLNGEPIKEIYICGGTSNIKNIKNYLSSKLNVEVHFYDPFKLIDSVNIDQDDKLRRKFTQVCTLAMNAPHKSRLINFLKGDYTLSSSSDLPIESMVFIGVRLGFLALLISFSLLVQTFMLSSQEKEITKIANGLYKNNIIKESLSTSLIRRARNKKRPRPDLIINKLKQKQKLIKQEVSVIQASLKTNAFVDLMDILGIINGYNVEIIKFSATEDKNLDFILSAKNIKELESLENIFKKDKTRKWFVELNTKKLTLSVGGKGKKI